MLVVKPGTLDDMSWAVPVGNIRTASKVPWVKIDETLVNITVKLLAVGLEAAGSPLPSCLECLR
jgi:hypothetical protein